MFSVLTKGVGSWTGEVVLQDGSTSSSSSRECRSAVVDFTRRVSTVVPRSHAIHRPTDGRTEVVDIHRPTDIHTDRLKYRHTDGCRKADRHTDRNFLMSFF